MNCPLSTHDVGRQKAVFVAAGCWFQAFWLGWASMHRAATDTWMKALIKRRSTAAPSQAILQQLFLQTAANLFHDLWHSVQTAHNMFIVFCCGAANQSMGTMYTISTGSLEQVWGVAPLTQSCSCDTNRLGRADCGAPAARQNTGQTGSPI